MGNVVMPEYSGAPQGFQIAQMLLF